MAGFFSRTTMTYPNAHQKTDRSDYYFLFALSWRASLSLEIIHMASSGHWSVCVLAQRAARQKVSYLLKDPSCQHVTGLCSQ